MLLWDLKTASGQEKLELIGSHERALLALETLDFSIGILMQSHQEIIASYHIPELQRAVLCCLAKHGVAVEPAPDLGRSVQEIDALLEEDKFHDGEWDIVMFLWTLLNAPEEGLSKSETTDALSYAYQPFLAVEIILKLEKATLESEVRVREAASEICMRVIDHHVGLLEGLPALPAFPYDSLWTFAKAQP